MKKKGCDRVERVVKDSRRRRGAQLMDFGSIWVGGKWARATTVVFSGPEPNMIRWSAMVEKGASRRNRVMESSRRIGEGKEDKNGEYWIT
jgi:hypothetical protein